MGSDATTVRTSRKLREGSGVGIVSQVIALALRVADPSPIPRKGHDFPVVVGHFCAAKKNRTSTFALQRNRKSRWQASRHDCAWRRIL